MSLNELLSLKTDNDKVVYEDITRERIQKDLPQLQELISFWRVYPDMFIDYLCQLDKNSTFRFYFYQRVFLRSVMRYKYVYAVYPRALS